MNDLYFSGYRDEGPGYLSNFGQITRCVAINGVHNEEALDRNTDAIKAQTEMQHAESDESQVQFSGHSMMLERESNESQQLFKEESDELQTLIETESDEMQALYKSESDETQQVLTTQGTNIQKAITAQTSSMKSESDESQEMLNSKLTGIVSELQGIVAKIQANTTGDSTNADKIVDAINNIKLVIN